MNVRYSTSRIFKLVFPLLVLLFLQIAANAQSTPNEQTCSKLVQGKVAWNKAGNTAWSDANISSLCKGTTNPSATVSCFKAQIQKHNDWTRGIVACQPSAVNSSNAIQGETQLNPEPLKDANNKTSADSGTIKRTITIKNNSGMVIIGHLIMRANYDDPNNQEDIKTSFGQTSQNGIGIGSSDTFGQNSAFSINKEVELWITHAYGNHIPLFKVSLPKNKDSTTFCYEVTGTYFVPSVKTCDGSPTYESKYISFKNEAGYNSTMSLTYYPTGGSTPKTAKTLSTTAGYQTKLYLPLDADTERQMTLKVDMGVTNRNLKQTNISLSNFDSDCYKVWGDALYPKVSPCSLDPSARTIKLWNNSGFIAELGVAYYDKDRSGKDVKRSVGTNKLQLTQTETIEVPKGTSSTPLNIVIINNYTGNSVLETTVPANYTGELCYKVEGTSFAPTAATCDDTVGDTSGKTRQIRFQNDAGYDAQMIVTYFVDEVINGQKIPMPKTLVTGMINGLGGKFRLVTIPKDTSKGIPITISLQGNMPKGNGAVFSTTLDANFAASPQPCFKVTGTLFNPSGGACNR